ncbi:MAG: hypothetical protein GTO76_12575 [Planctomycetales bacterium]|nr:hypothetical protein [Planctomycetales bacterium]NIO35750.1 hypothetical protein [Planctomycetales bacterium]NIP05627.1 hypothetical protein [Planctomycetales bacterium]
MSCDAELVVGLGYDELAALANSVLPPSAESQLDKLWERNAKHQGAADEQKRHWSAVGKFRSTHDSEDITPRSAEGNTTFPD